jgi:hypothetical protein
LILTPIFFCFDPFHDRIKSKFDIFHIFCDCVSSWWCQLFFIFLALFEYSFRLLLTRVSRSFAPSLQTISLFNTESHDFLSSSYPINNTEIFLFTLNKWWSDGWRSFVRFVEFKWPDFLWSVKIFGKMFI